MGSFSIWHWLVVLVIVLVLFGRGRVSEIMGDFGKGIKSFKEGMNEDEKKSDKPDTPPAQITSQQQGESAPSVSETKNEQA